MLEVRSLTKVYGSEVGLRATTFSLNEATSLRLIGLNGSGKSVLLRLIGGFATPSSGEIFFNGVSLNGLCPEERLALGILYLPQFVTTRSDATVEDVLSRGQLQPDEAKLEIANLSASALQELMFRFLLNSNTKPKLLLLDEPSFITNQKSRSLRALASLPPPLSIIYVSHSDKLFHSQRVHEELHLSADRHAISRTTLADLGSEVVLAQSPKIAQSTLQEYHVKKVPVSYGNQANRGFSPTCSVEGVIQLLRGDEQKQALKAILTRLNLQPLDYTRPLMSFSGGNRQKISLGLALVEGIKKREVLLIDPWSSLDQAAVAITFNEIAYLISQGVRVIILVTDLEWWAQHA